MKINGTQWIEIIRAISTAIIAIITTLCVQSCTMSLSVAKNNNNATQKTEQTATSSIDSTKININPKKPLNYDKLKRRVRNKSPPIVTGKQIGRAHV